MARVFDKVAPDLLLLAYRLTRDTSADPVVELGPGQRLACQTVATRGGG